MAHQEASSSLVTAGTWEVDAGHWPTLMVADEDSDPWERDVVLLAHPQAQSEEQAQGKAEQDRLTVEALAKLEDRVASARDLGYRPLDELEGG
jgi:hypothetical protein